MHRVLFLVAAGLLLLAHLQEASSFSPFAHTHGGRWLTRSSAKETLSLSRSLSVRGGAANNHNNNGAGEVQQVESVSALDALLASAAESNKLVVVDFTASWCGPCQRIAPVYAQLAREHAQRAVLVKVDVDAASAIAAKYNVMSMPTFLFIKQGEVVERFSGASPDKLKQTIAALTKQ